MNKAQEKTFFHGQMSEINFRYKTKARKVMVDFKFDALLVKSLPVGCISGWNSTCQPYIESYHTLINKNTFTSKVKKVYVGMVKRFSKKYGNKG